jgi:hypothetical protein
MQPQILRLPVSAALLIQVVSDQPPPTRVNVSGDLTVTTSDSLALTAVTVRGRAWREDIESPESVFVFCITHQEPLPAKLNYTGKGRVVYLTPRNETSAVAKTGSPEPILPALAVLQSDGESRFFLAEGQPYPHAPDERSVGRVSRFKVIDLSRRDYLDRDGMRRGTDPSSCFASVR